MGGEGTDEMEGDGEEVMIEGEGIAFEEASVFGKVACGLEVGREMRGIVEAGGDWGVKVCGSQGADDRGEAIKFGAGSGVVVGRGKDDS